MQLDGGVRLIEIDLHTDGFQALGDYQIGHDQAGDHVSHQDGNPASNSFVDWIAQIAEWSRRYPRHAPIQLLLDTKSNFDLPSAAAGNHGALNARLRAAFGGSLVTPSQIFNWPDVDALRGRVIVVLSGDSETRTSYSLDRGANPAVAINGNGQIVEVHESQTGNHGLWYWTGEARADGGITWRRHGRYGIGTTPAVAINDDGWLVEVHKSQNHDRLWYQIGRLTSDLDIIWGYSHDYDDGILPTIRFDTNKGFTLREIHRSQAHNQNWDWSVMLDPTGPFLSLSTNARTGDPRWPTAHAGAVAVQASADDILVYRTIVIDRAPICYEQLAFVEYQPGDPDQLRNGARFAGAPADDSNNEFLTDARLMGLVTRGWSFASDSPRLHPPENYPATDTPFDDWYATYSASIGAVA